VDQRERKLQPRSAVPSRAVSAFALSLTCVNLRRRDGP